MRVKPIQDGGRSISIDTTYLMLDATVNADGTITTHALEIRDPNVTSAEDLRIAEANAGICEECPSLKKIRDDQLAVDCRDCGCGYMDLARGKCPRKKW